MTIGAAATAGGRAPVRAHGRRDQRRRSALQTLRLGAVVGILLLSGGAGSGAAAASTFLAEAVQVVVIGDSLSTGVNTAGESWVDEAQGLFSTHGPYVHLVNAAENGAGYLTRGEHGDDFLGQVEQVVDAHAQVVIVFGSDNDLGRPDLETAVVSTLNRVRARAPLASLIVVGPPAPPADPPASLTTIRDALRTAARRVGGQFVDPLASKWFQGADTKYVSADGEHPNYSGELYLARRLSAVLAPPIAHLLSAPHRISHTGETAALRTGRRLKSILRSCGITPPLDLRPTAATYADGRFAGCRLRHE
jgi:acyl-CoA thioesterase I